jgi:hypothetical protein
MRAQVLDTATYVGRKARLNNWTKAKLSMNFIAR